VATRQGNPAAADTERTAPDQPTDLGVRSWGGVFRRTIREFREDNLTDLAAALIWWASPRRNH
jgi:membrane protein